MNEKDKPEISELLKAAFTPEKIPLNKQIVENDDGTFVRIPLGSDEIEIYDAEGVRVYDDSDFHPDEFDGMHD